MSRSTLLRALRAGALCLTATTAAAVIPAAADAHVGVSAKRLNIQSGSRVTVKGRAAAPMTARLQIQRRGRWICRRAVIGAAARPLTVPRLPLWMFKRFELTPTCASAAAGMTVAVVVAVRHSAPAPRARRSVDRDIDPPVFPRPARSAYRASQRSPRARPPGSAWPSRDPPPASTSCTRGSA